VSTVLGRFVIPIYYVLGERAIDFFRRLRRPDDRPTDHGNSLQDDGAGG
jgi:HAE1 family hydrophobic/amphiphilic exporter-1